MPKRSRGATALSVVSVLVGLYCQFAAMALIIAASVFAPTGAAEVPLVLVIGLVFLVLMVLAYVTAFGFWFGRAWAWAASLTEFVGLIAASGILALASSNVVSAVLPIVGGSIGIWYLMRPATKSALGRDGRPAAADATNASDATAAGGSMDATQAIR